MNSTLKLPIGREVTGRLFAADAKRRGNNLQNGFTLMELLIVIAIILILMLMAIPTIGTMTIRGNETSAINSVQMILKAELQYSSTYPANGYACSLATLGGDPNAGLPTPTSAQLIQADLASGYKSGYLFTVTCTDKVTINGTDRSNGYKVTAVPQTVGKSGVRTFCSDQYGSIKYDPSGGTNCSQTLQ